MLLHLYFFFLGWVSVMSPHEWISLPMLIILIMILPNVLKVKSGVEKSFSSREFHYILVIFYLFGISTVISLLIQQFLYGYDLLGFVHLLRYFSIFILFYFFPVFVIIGRGTSPQVIYKYITWGVLFVAVFTILEFISKNILGFDFDSLVPRPAVSQFNATYGLMGERFIRARGTTEESGHLALYLSMFTPLAYYYFGQQKLRFRYIYMSLIALSIILTFSAMGFVELIILLLFIVVVNFRSRGLVKVWTIIGLMLSLLTGIYLFYVKELDYNSLFSGVIAKITLSDEAFSFDGSRIQRWSNAFDLITDQPLFGHGSGIMSILYSTGSTSMYLELLVEFGVVGLFLFLLYVLIHLLLLFKLNSKIKYFYFVSLCISLMHYTVISNYWYPWSWTIFVLIVVEYVMQQLNNISTKERYI